MPYYQSGVGKGVSFFYSKQRKRKKKTQTKTVAFVSCRKSYTHRSPFSNYFLIWSFTVAISVQSFGTCFLCQTFCLLMNCHVHNVIFILNFIIVFFVFFHCCFCFVLCFASNWTSNVCDILYAFLFDVGKLRLGYLMMILLYLENVYYYY